MPPPRKPPAGVRGLRDVLLEDRDDDGKPIRVVDWELADALKACNRAPSHFGWNDFKGIYVVEPDGSYHRG